MITNFIKGQASGAIARLLTAGLLAGATTLALPAKANAQEVYFGGPAPRYDRDFRFDHDRHAYFESRRLEAIRREHFLREEEWRREHSFRDHDRRFDREHFGFDRRFDYR